MASGVLATEWCSLPMQGRALLSTNVRRIRLSRGISQERLAADAGIGRAYLGGIERQTENPTVDLLDRLASALAVPLSALFVEPSQHDTAPTPLPRGRKRG